MSEILTYVRISVHNLHSVQHVEDDDLRKKKEWV